jgi:pantoate kinase
VDCARAFAPGNISGVFKISAHQDPEKMHSLGMGLTVSEGVVVEVRHADESVVRLNGEVATFPTVRSVAAAVTDVAVSVAVETALPISSGFGLSGASALATAYALNSLLDLGRSEEELAMAAHVAEVKNLTGLGDVCGQFHGGCLVKLEPGQPLKARRLPVAEQPVFYRYFSAISTRAILSDPARVECINQAADQALQRLSLLAERESVDFADCIRVSREFSENSGLLEDQGVRRIIEQVEAAGGSASMIMLGNAVFSQSPFDGALRTTLSTGRAHAL